MNFQDPAVVFNIAKKHSAFRLKRNGVVRSIDKLNATGSFIRDDGIFSSEKISPMSFEPVRMKKNGEDSDGVCAITMAHTKDSKGHIRSFLITKKNANKVAKKIENRKASGRMASAHAFRAQKVVRSTTRAMRKSPA